MTYLDESVQVVAISNNADRLVSTEGKLVTNEDLPTRTVSTLIVFWSNTYDEE